MPKGSDNIQNLSPGELIRRCLDGHKPSWNEFFRRYNKTIINQIIKTLVNRNRLDLAGDKDVIDNVFEQIFIKLYCQNALEQLNDPDKVVAWLRTIAKNKTLDWINSYFRNENLPERKAENATLSIETPIDKDGDSNYHNILPDKIQDDAETRIELDHIISEMKKLREKELWVLRLKVMFYDPLDEKEIREIAWFTGKPFKKLKENINFITERLLDKKEIKENDLKSSVRIFHLIRRLESCLLEDLNKQELSADEIKKIRDEISRRRNRMEFLLNSGNQLIEPSNKEIAEIMGIPEEKAGQVSVLLHRTRAKLESMKKNRSTHKEN